MYLISSMLGFSGTETAEFTQKWNKQKIIHLHDIVLFLTFTTIFTSGTLFTVIVIALFLHILWDAPTTNYFSAAHPFIVHVIQ